MNIIASLIRTRPQQAEQAVEDLSDLFRATLRDSGSMVPITEEWRLCENYLRIEGLRLGDRLTVKVDLSEVPENAAIPMLTLQPLVENAIYHGIQALEGGGTIQVIGKIEDNHIQIVITNPVPPYNLRRISQGNKIAVANIMHRLHLLFGSQANLSATVSESLYEVTLVFPYVESDL
jgi:two-component system sensor histidine kinase AlgZ